MFSFFIAGAPMHGMNCVDIVIGTAHGTQFRVFDYYTCDHSTPLFDEMEEEWNSRNYSCYWKRG